MEIIFFGTSEFAVTSLRAIYESTHEIKAVFTSPDKKKGRYLKVTADSVKEAGLALGLKVHCVDDLTNPYAAELLHSYGADLFVVVSYGHLLTKDILEIPKYYSIGLHPSLLPKYRGAAPVNWAIINGEKFTGVSIMKMNESMDKGDIILMKTEKIKDDDDAKSLSARLFLLGARLLVECINDIESKNVIFTKQDDAQASYARKLRKTDGLIDWPSDAVSIYNRIRGLIPWPGAFSFLNGRSIKILKAKPIHKYHNGSPGEIIDFDKGKIIVACSSGTYLKILELQPVGKPAMSVTAFLNGHKVTIGQVFASK